MTIINVALFGLGRMGQIHLHNLLADTNVNVKYVYDPMGVNADLSSRLVRDPNSIFEDPSVSACVIATPSTLHAELILACAKANKHVFCEKPVSFDVETLRSLKSEVTRAGINVQIGFNRRFDPSIARMREQIHQDAVGTINIIKITNRDPKRPQPDFVKNSGGLFFDFNVHDFDMLRFIADDDIVEVYAVGDALVDPSLKALNDIDTAVITVKFKTGALGIIDCSRETGYGYDQQLEVFGSQGMLHLNNQRRTEVKQQSLRGQIADDIHYSFVERYRDSYRHELRHFFTSISANNVSPGLDDAIAAVNIATAAQTSLSEKRAVLVTE